MSTWTLGTIRAWSPRRRWERIAGFVVVLMLAALAFFIQQSYAVRAFYWTLARVVSD